jgi:hypothetical protein
MMDDTSKFVASTITKTQTLVDSSMDKSYTLTTHLIKNGRNGLKQSIVWNLNNLTFDMENGVASEWNSDGTQRPYDRCAKRASDGQYPTGSGECTSIQFMYGTDGPYNCEWSATKSKCGYFEMPTVTQMRAGKEKKKNCLFCCPTLCVYTFIPDIPFGIPFCMV